MVKALVRPAAREGFINASNVALAAPVILTLPKQRAGNGKLTLSKENGAVKGFEYRCVCGHCDYFVCE